MHLRGLVCQLFMSFAIRKEVSSIFTISSVGMLVAVVSSVMLTIFLLHLYLPCTITLESRQSFCLVAIFLSVVAPRPFNFRALLGGVGDPWGRKLNFKRAVQFIKSVFNHLLGHYNYDYEIFVLRKILRHPLRKASLIPLTTSRLCGRGRSNGSSASLRQLPYDNHHYHKN